MPESLDDYVSPENPVRFIEAFVDGLDLTTAGFVRVSAGRTGRPGCAPTDLLKLYVYGYLNRVRSSRRLEAETLCNIEVIWLLRHLKLARIASPGMLPNGELLPRLICSRPLIRTGVADEAVEHGDA